MITKFVDREQDLGILKKRYRQKGFQFIPIHGRRRIGKTELILQFIKDTPSLYFQATAGTKKENIRLFKQAAKPVVDLGHIRDDWEALFKHLTESLTERTVVVIDEFPYLLETEKGLSSLFQRIIDQHLQDSDLYLILCGSSLSMMHKEVLSHKAPLHGRRTGQLDVKPLTFAELQPFFPAKPFEDVIAIYSICGGVPAYLREFTAHQSLSSLIRDKILLRGALLREEVPFLLRSEFRDPRVYLSILSAISLGHRKLGDIINYLGFTGKTSITPYLHNLEQLGYITRELPVTETPRSKKGLYAINDSYVSFWLKMVRRNTELIDQDPPQALKKINRDLPAHIAPVFEDVCRQFLWHEKPFDFDTLGRWWHRNQEIDIVAYNKQTREILFGECKWQSNVSGRRILAELHDKAHELKWHNQDRREHYVVFAKNFKHKETQPGQQLYDLDDLRCRFRQNQRHA